MATAQSTSKRHVRERALVAATRALFDERGMLDAPVEAIAKEVGIARGLIYRQFSSKDELYVLTITDYLSELAGILAAAIDGAGSDPVDRLRACGEAFARYCQRYPAFIDSALSQMQRPASDLRELVSESVWLRLGQGMSNCIDQLTQILRDGDDAGRFTVADPDFTSNLLWTQTLGAMHLARIQIGLRRAAPGIPEAFEIDPERVVQSCVDTAMATVAAR
jgi:AcrR family transcriptional regulator